MNGDYSDGALLQQCASGTTFETTGPRPHGATMSNDSAGVGPVERVARPQAQQVADHIEQRLRTWRQQHMNRSGDCLALDDFMGDDSIADLVDYVCDECALDALLHAAPATGGSDDD